MYTTALLGKEPYMVEDSLPGVHPIVHPSETDPKGDSHAQQYPTFFQNAFTAFQRAKVNHETVCPISVVFFHQQMIKHNQNDSPVFIFQ